MSRIVYEERHGDEHGRLAGRRTAAAGVAR